MVALAGAFLLRPANDDPDRPEGLPAFDLPLLSGEGRLTSEELAGDPVVINFWASWCGPCRDEAPLLEETWQQYKDQGLQFVGIDVQDSPIKAREFVEDFNITYPIATDLDQVLFKKFGAVGLPLTLFVTRDGELLANEQLQQSDPGAETRVFGPIEEDDLEAKIERLLEGAGT